MRRVLLMMAFFSLLPLLSGLPPARGQEAKEANKPEAHADPGPIGAVAACPCTFGPLIADTAAPIQTGKFSIQPTALMSFTRGVFTSNWRRVSANGNFTSLQLPVKFTYGPMKNMEVYVVASYVHHWADHVDNPSPRGPQAADFGGLGDILTAVKYQFLEESQAAPTLTGLFSVNFPTGHYHPENPGKLGSDHLGSGTYNFTAGLLASKYVNPFIFYGNLTYTVSTTTRFHQEIPLQGLVVRHLNVQDLLALRLAAEYPFGGKGPWVALLEFYSAWETGRIFHPRPATSPGALLGFLPGLEYVHSHKLAFATGVAIDLAGKNRSFNYTPIVSMNYTF